MTIAFENILAAGGGGIVFVILLLIFWGVALGSLAKKQKERDRQMLDAMRNATKQVPARPGPPLSRPPKAVPKFPSRQQLSKLASRAPVKAYEPLSQKRIASRPPQRVPPRPPVAPVATVVREASTAPVAQAAPRAAAAAPRPAAPSASARSIAHWLRPGTLRSQFILTEVFQAPVALRADRVI